MSTEILKGHLSTLGMEIVKIDTTISDTKDIPAKQLVILFKQRTDLQDVAAFVNYLIAASEGKHPCSEGHTFNGVLASINPSITQIQHAEWIGNPCDCRRLIYDEGMCNCPSQKNWEIHWQPNPKY